MLPLLFFIIEKQQNYTRTSNKLQKTQAKPKLPLERTAKKKIFLNENEATTAFT